MKKTDRKSVSLFPELPATTPQTKTKSGKKKSVNHCTLCDEPMVQVLDKATYGHSGLCDSCYHRMGSK